MSNKINGLSGASPTVEGGGSARRAPETASTQSSGSTPSAAAGGSDVHITGSASLLSGLAQHLRSLPAVDAARVTQFQSAIDNGTYSVQPGTVANQLMQFEQSLAQLRGG